MMYWNVLGPQQRFKKRASAELGQEDHMAATGKQCASMMRSICAAALLATATAQRQMVSLDFGWRVADAHKIAPPTCS